MGLIERHLPTLEITMPFANGVPINVKASMKFLGVYKTPLRWLYPEPPVDYRALDGLRAWDSNYANFIHMKYMRKHGGYDGIVKSLTNYDRYYANFNKFPDDVKCNWDLAIQDCKIFFVHLPHKASPVPWWYYRPNASNSGAPYFKNRRDIVDLIHHEAGELVEKIWDTPDLAFVDYLVDPVIPYVKSVTSKRAYGPKTRAIWCYPAVMTCIEHMFGSSLYHLLLQNKHTAHIPFMHGQSAFKDSRMFIRSTDIGQGVRVSDWVKGDQQMPPWLLKLAFEILESLIDFNTFAGRPVGKLMAKRLKRVFDYVRWYFINTPIVIGDYLYRKAGGIPSGSLFTLMVWNMCSLLVNCYLTRTVECRRLDWKDVVVCGDDNAARVYTPGLEFSVFARAARKCGLIFHGYPKSQLEYWPNHDKVISLSSRYNDPSRLERDEDDLFARFIYPQRFSANREESVARSLMLDMSVLKTMPRVHAFTLFYLKWKPVNLKKPIYTDKDINKYFRYVADAPWLTFPDDTTIYDILVPYGDDHKWMMLFAVAF